MNNLKIYKIILIAFLIIFLSPFFTFAEEILETQEPIDNFYEKALVIGIEEKTKETKIEGATKYETIQEIKVKILGGKYKNEEKIIENTTSNNPLDIKVKENERLAVYISEYEDGSTSIQIQDYWRLPILIWFIVAFLFVLLIIGGKQGLRAIISLTISIFFIFIILVPGTFAGYNPVWLSIIISALVTIISLLIISGIKKKSAAAILGTIGGLIIAALLSIIVSKIARLTGLASEESRTLFSQFPNIKPQGLLFGSIIIGALGAIMGVGISIASSISEIKKAIQ